MEDKTPNEKQPLTLPFLITKGLVVYPNMNEAVDAGRPYSMEAIRQAKANSNSLLFVGCQKEADKDDIKIPDDVFETATLCRIVYTNEKDGSIKVRLIGSRRVLLSNIRFEKGSYIADGSILEDEEGDANEELQLIAKLSQSLATSNFMNPNVVKNTLTSLQNGDSVGNVVDTIAQYLDFRVADKVALLAERNTNERLKILLRLLDEQKQITQIEQKLDETVRERAEKSQKEYFLREKMKAIKDELGEGAGVNDVDAIKAKLEKNPYPENVKAKIKNELHRMEMMPDGSLESSLILNYIQTLINVPWYQRTEDNDDLSNVQKILDENHFGLEKVKKRIIEYLAVKQATGTLKAPILCFYGPPGCGKTSLAKSIAQALGRKFYKCSLGGVSDEAEIRGHRRTYVGALPGRIIQGMTRAGTVNPVFLLDEIDKVGGANYRGDPSSALLEVLDPEQNFAFNDNFLEEPYDLSNVLFIATANYLENVPAPLRDRLELIEVPSYTEIEKLKIAADFLIQKQMKANGLKEGDIIFTEEGIREMIEFYTREAGVRELERLVASCCRKAIVELIKNPSLPRPIKVDAEQVKKYLGVEIFEDTKKEKEPQIGVVTGLAYTEFGGDILPIEATHFHGKGQLVLTGNLKDIMKESCMIALDYVRANATKYGIPEEMFEKNDIHLHFPEGAVPKDGPSAGIAITCAIISSLSGKPVNNNVAMTGEVTLRGKALPIGGLREKSLAALRSGIKTILVPEENKKDVDELPEEVKKGLAIHFMKCVDDALPFVFETENNKA
ncbi:MAG: endopeptidase La [Mollicutes bacterium]|nr:endopeptidase La [Mollicutes bacterium]